VPSLHVQEARIGIVVAEPTGRAEFPSLLEQGLGLAEPSQQPAASRVDSEDLRSLAGAKSLTALPQLREAGIARCGIRADLRGDLSQVSPEGLTLLVVGFAPG
jgi:hypothetical protein